MNNNQIFDRELLIKNLNRFSKNFEQSNFLFHEIANRLKENILDFKQEFNDILEIGARDGYLGEEISKIKNTKNLVQTNLTKDFAGIIIDDEKLELNQQFDLIINFLNLHFVNDVLGNLIKSKTLLKQDGIFIGCFFGGTTLKELREVFNKIELEIYGGISPRIIPFIDVKTAGSLLQKAGFKNVITDSQIIEISYSSLLKLLQDLRNMGLGNILIDQSKKPITKKMLFLMENLIKELYPDAPLSFIVSFEVITITGF